MTDETMCLLHIHIARMPQRCFWYTISIHGTPDMTTVPLIAEAVKTTDVFKCVEELRKVVPDIITVDPYALDGRMLTPKQKRALRLNEV